MGEEIHWCPVSVWIDLWFAGSVCCVANKLPVPGTGVLVSFSGRFEIPNFSTDNLYSVWSLFEHCNLVPVTDPKRLCHVTFSAARSFRYSDFAGVTCLSDPRPSKPSRLQLGPAGFLDCPTAILPSPEFLFRLIPPSTSTDPGSYGSQCRRPEIMTWSC